MTRYAVIESLALEKFDAYDRIEHKWHCMAAGGCTAAVIGYVSVDVIRQGWHSFGVKELDLGNKWVFEGEKIINGKPFGIDNTVNWECTFIFSSSSDLGCLSHHNRIDF